MKIIQSELHPRRTNEFKKEILTSENLSEIFDTKLHINEKNGRYFVEEIG